MSFWESLETYSLSILPSVLGKVYEADPELGVVRQEREPSDLETQER